MSKRIAQRTRKAAEISPAQVRAARAMLGWSHFRLARKARVGRATVQRLELGASVWPSSVEAIKVALEGAGIEFLAARKGGTGVCVLNDIGTGRNASRRRP
jgi:transcriptional regulator with XRE-family HTH domain